MIKADFQHWESDDNYVYEYNDGFPDPTTSWKQDEVLLVKRLTRSFTKTDAYKQEGELIGEIGGWVTEQQIR